jgi:hypothetical protein
MNDVNAINSRTEAFDHVRSALKGAGQKHLGDVVWVDIEDVDVLRSEIRDRFKQNGLDEKLAPVDPTPDAAFGAAVGLWRQSKDSPIFVRRADSADKRRGSDALVIRQKSAQDKLDSLITEARVGLQSGSFHVFAKGAGFDTEEVQTVIKQLRKTYHHARDFANGAELGKCVVDVILETCKGIRMRDRGSVYYVNAAQGALVRSLQNAVEGLGKSHLAVLELHDGSANVGEVQRSATSAFANELEAITTELAAFREDAANGQGPKVSTLQRRIAEYKSLTDRVDLYAEILGDKQSQLLAGLEKAKRAVERMIAES